MYLQVVTEAFTSHTFMLLPLVIVCITGIVLFIVCTLQQSTMLWKTLFLAFAILGEGRGDESPNLAWELIQGFMHIWNHTNQRICVPIPRSSGEGIGFSIVNLNLFKLLESKLCTIVNNCTANCTWGRVKVPFENQPNNIFGGPGG